ncbi:lipoprotein [Listeria monocytogenes]
MSKKWISIILLSALFLLVGCGKGPVENKKVVEDKEVISSKFAGKWKLETFSMGKPDRTGYREVNNGYSREFEMDSKGNIEEVLVYDNGTRTYTYKIKPKIGDEYQNDGSTMSKEVYKYETVSEKQYVKELLETFKGLDTIKITLSEQKGNEYVIETEQMEDFTFFMYLSDKKLIKEAVYEKEKVSSKDIYIKQ